MFAFFRVGDYIHGDFRVRNGNQIYLPFAAICDVTEEDNQEFESKYSVEEPLENSVEFIKQPINQDILAVVLSLAIAIDLSVVS